jgi:hypothetical protein
MDANSWELSTLRFRRIIRRQFRLLFGEELDDHFAFSGSLSASTRSRKYLMFISMIVRADVFMTRRASSLQSNNAF